MAFKPEQGSGGAQFERCLVVHPDFPNSISHRSLDDILSEAKGLAQAINLEVMDARVYKVSRVHAGCLLSKGHRDTIAGLVQDLKPHVVIVNHTLSPVQQRNLEKEWMVKVIDRTGLILEIFGARASTKEGRLQVEMAALQYQRGRLVRAWTHLERQRGGAGFMGGPGERQIELDRRKINDKITRLKREIEDVRRTRDIGRQARERVPFPVIALVGYTNAGKSTLFNTLTNAGILAEDMLFATLDPTLRKIQLPNDQMAILSDTVGFISDLPTHLIAAFGATLEQTIQADAILHVIDVSRPDYQAQRRDVIKILGDLGIEYAADERIIEVYNKIDVASDALREDLARDAVHNRLHVPICAVDGRGVDALLKAVVGVIGRNRKQCVYKIAATEGRALSWLHEHAEVLHRTHAEEFVILNVMIDDPERDKFHSHFGYKPQE